jgi:hypothetical protein
LRRRKKKGRKADQHPEAIETRVQRLPRKVEEK